MHRNHRTRPVTIARITLKDPVFEDDFTIIARFAPNLGEGEREHLAGYNQEQIFPTTLLPGDYTRCISIMPAYIGLRC